MMRRFAMGAYLSASLLVGACSSGGHKQSESTTTTSIVVTPTTATAVRHAVFAAAKYGFAFDYPRSWHLDSYDVDEHYAQIAGFVSNEKLHYPCTFFKNAAGMGVTCGAPLTRLHPEGVLVSWNTLDGPPGPGAHLDSQPGYSLTLDGHRAKLVIESPGDCAGIGGAQTITASIVRQSLNSHDFILRMQACLGPEALGAQAAVLQMLHSVRL